MDDSSIPNAFPYSNLSRSILAHLYHKIDNIPEQDIAYFTEVLSGSYNLISIRYNQGEGAINVSPEGQPPAEETESLTILTLGVLAAHFLKNEQTTLPEPESLPFNES